MKSIILVAVTFFILPFANAQYNTVDHLKYKLSIANTDSAKAITLDSLAMYYMFFTTKPDSSFTYINRLINYSFNLKDKKYLILGYARMSFYYVNVSQYKA